MKKILSLIAVLSFLLFSGASEAAEMVNQMRHADWSSYIIQKSGKKPFPRMICQIKNGSNLLALDFSATESRVYAVEIITPIDWTKHRADIADLDRQGGKVTLPCNIRIDENQIFYHKATVTRSEQSIFLNIAGGLDRKFIEQSRLGKTVRFQVTFQDNTTLYGAFSLNGFTAAFNRCVELQNRLIQTNRKDSDYFTDVPAPKTDKDYFPAK